MEIRPFPRPDWSPLPGAVGVEGKVLVRDGSFFIAMLRFREEHMIGGVARRLKRGIDQGQNPGAVFSRVQDHVIAAARAHAERLVLEAFVAKTAALPDGDLDDVARGLAPRVSEPGEPPGDRVDVDEEQDPAGDHQSSRDDRGQCPHEHALGGAEHQLEPAQQQRDTSPEVLDHARRIAASNRSNPGFVLC